MLTGHLPRGSSSSPQVKRARSSPPRAAFSHSASVGSRLPAQGAVGQGVVVGDVDHRVVLAPGHVGGRTVGVSPGRPADRQPPRGRLGLPDDVGAVADVRRVEDRGEALALGGRDVAGRLHERRERLVGDRRGVDPEGVGPPRSGPGPRRRRRTPRRGCRPSRTRRPGSAPAPGCWARPRPVGVAPRRAAVSHATSGSRAARGGLALRPRTARRHGSLLWTLVDRTDVTLPHRTRQPGAEPSQRRSGTRSRSVSQGAGLESLGMRQSPRGESGTA